MKYALNKTSIINVVTSSAFTCFITTAKLEINGAIKLISHPQ